MLCELGDRGPGKVIILLLQEQTWTQMLSSQPAMHILSAYNRLARGRRLRCSIAYTLTPGIAVVLTVVNWALGHSNGLKGVGHP